MQRQNVKIPKECHDRLIFGSKLRGMKLEQYIVLCFNESETFKKHSLILVEAKQKDR